MAQDFGDDMGDFIFQTIRRWISNRIRDAYNDRRYERRMERRLAEEKGRDHDASEQGAQDASEQDVQGGAPQNPEPVQADTVCVPFGSAQDAAYFTRICREDGIEMDALTDDSGNGFVRFDPADTDRLADCCREFSELAGRLKEREIAERIDQSQALDEGQVERLREIRDLPDLPKQRSGRPDLGTVAHEAKAASARETSLTQGIADRVREAREDCRTFDDFKERLAERGVGVTTTKDGENMFYQARHGEDGKLLPFGRDDAGNRDWAVGAKTLKERYDVDATHDWFEKNTPKGPYTGLEEMVMTPEGPMSGSAAARRWDEIAKDLGTQKPADILRRWNELGRQAQEPLRVGSQREYEPQATDGSLDADGRTPDINQGIESHDGMDTDARTLRLEREQNGTDVAPSKVREEQAQARGDDRSLNTVAEQCRASSKQLETESGVIDRDIDISDKLNPVR